MKSTRNSAIENGQHDFVVNLSMILVHRTCKINRKTNMESFMAVNNSAGMPLVALLLMINTSLWIRSPPHPQNPQMTAGVCYNTDDTYVILRHNTQVILGRISGEVDTTLASAASVASAMSISTVQEAVENGGLAAVPAEFVLPEQDRARRRDGEMVELPVIDMAGAGEAGGERRRAVVEAVRAACVEWGFFQAVNHGVPRPLMQRMQRVAREFFQLPLEEKRKCSAQTGKQTLGSFGYGSKFRAREGAASNWGDQLRHWALPASARQYEHWPTNPPSYRETEEEYIEELDRLTRLLYELLSEGLGLHTSYLSEFFGHERNQQIMVVNYYPPCPQPELTMGIQKHSDVGSVTLLLQDSTSGLEISKDGDWIPVKPIEDAFVINMGDTIEILTNGKYRSVEHRGLVNSLKPRMSIATFSSPRDCVLIGPIPDLLDEFNIPQYNQINFGDYRTSFFVKGCEGKEHLKTVTVE